MILHTTFIKKQFSDEELISGVYNKIPKMQEAFFKSCEKYFFRHYQGVFFIQKSDADDIFQNSVIALMQNIERRKIYVENGIIMGNNKKFEGTLHTYLMGIAKLKYLEWTRHNHREPNWTDLTQDSKGNPMEVGTTVTNEWLNDDPAAAKKEIIADCISKMSERCYQILTMFYDEEKNLDTILVELRSFNSKDALKTAKNKCLNKLKESANSIYEIRKQYI